MLNSIGWFVCGFNFGVVATGILVFFKLKQILMSLYPVDKTVVVPSSTEQVPTKSAPYSQSVLDRLNKAGELTKIQNDIVSQTQAPSKSAAHSKHKNGLIQQWKLMEDEKMAILSSIVQEGHDPMVTVYNASTQRQEEIKLSAFLATMGMGGTVPAQATTTDPKINTPESMRKIEKDGKTFFVIDGGKKTTQ